MRVVVFTAVVAFALLVAGSAQAFCGFYVSGADAKLFANASQVVLMREGTRTVLSMQNDYQGPPEGFAMVVPVPVVLQKENVKTLPHEIFARLDKLDAPRLVEYWERDPCTPVARARHRPGSAVPMPSPKRTSAAGAKDFGVSIEAEFTVGEYDIVVLGAKDSAGLDTWLRHEHYKIPEGSEPFLRPYVANGSKFFVAKVDPTKVKMVGNKATLSPLRFHYDARELSLPIRLGLVNSAGVQDLIVHVLGKGHRYEVANYPNVAIPTNLDVAETAREQFGSFYAALFDRTVAKSPRAVVTEYAWDAGSCDPCPTPPLTDSELVTLGADVLPSVASETDEIGRDLLKALGADAGKRPSPGSSPFARPSPRRKYYGLRSSFVLTRLHARYTRDAVGDDLIFREAPALNGGREVRSGADGTLETTAAVAANDSGTNAFQGRYAIRHPWSGAVECASPVRNVWGGPPNGLDNGGAKPATGLAYVARDNVHLASFLRSDITALDVKAGGVAPSGVGTFTPSAPPPPPGDAGDANAASASASANADAGVSGARRSGCAGCATASSSAPPPTAGLFVVLGALCLATRRKRGGP